MLSKSAVSTYPFWNAFIRSLQKKRASLVEENKGLEQLLDASVNVVVPLWEPFASRSGVQSSKIERIIELLDLCLLTGRSLHCKGILSSVLKSTGTIESKFTVLYSPLLARLPELLH